LRLTVAVNLRTFPRRSGAGNESRTRDLNLGKATPPLHNNKRHQNYIQCRSALLRVQKGEAMSDYSISRSALQGERTQITIALPYGAQRSAEIIFSVEAPRVQHERVDDLVTEHLKQIKRAVANLPEK
jgi:hypothetical protein